MSNSYPSPYVKYKNRKISIKKIKTSKFKFKFKFNNIMVTSNKIFLKLKDKVIELI